MKSVILKMAAQVVKFFFLGISVWLLFRGHNYPGGGFIGGLIAGSALIFDRMAFDTDVINEKPGKKGTVFLPLGMGCVLISMIAGAIGKKAVMEGLWVQFNIPGIQEPIKMGTPILFDIGVYFTVIGFIYLIYKSIMEEWQWK